MRRHFTATGYITRHDAVLLHWHVKLRMWLPPGGHVEPNEDPAQTALREALEETGVEARILPTGSPRFEFSTPEQVQPPVTILIEDIDDPVDGFHQHIDSIYFLAPIGGPPTAAPDGWHWVTREQLVENVAIPSPDGNGVRLEQDVRDLGILAIDTYRSHHQERPRAK